MKNYDVYGIGNALVDTEYEVDDNFLTETKLSKGIMTLIEEEDRARLIDLLETRHKITPIAQTGGGSAANTMVAISQLGSSSFYSCKVANDETGDFFMSDLASAGVDTNLDQGREQGATGQCISMITPDAERTMTTCLGITNFLSARELNHDALTNSNRLYIEGYLVSSPSGFQAALEAQTIARNNNVQVSLTLSDPAMVENFKANYDTILNQGVDLLFCNHAEAKLLTGAKSTEECVVILKDVCHSFVVTCGDQGAIAFDGTNENPAPGVPTTAVDTTGAGDIFAGAFLQALCSGKPFAEANQIANRAASLVVSRFGARLTQPEADALLK